MVRLAEAGGVTSQPREEGSEGGGIGPSMLLVEKGEGLGTGSQGVTRECDSVDRQRCKADWSVFWREWRVIYLFFKSWHYFIRIIPSH